MAGPDSDLAQERTFAFVDLAGFTALTEAHGDSDAVALIDRFIEFTHEALGPGDQLVKGMGDEVMLSFAAPEPALDALGRLLASCHQAENFPIPRTGIHHGPALPRGDDWFGAAVNLAARVAGQAHGGQTLATEAVAAVARERRISVTDLGAFSLRNVAEPVELYELALSSTSEATSIDPVCRMQVRHGVAVGRLRHHGGDYWFCSLDCVAAFASQPDRYAPGEPAGPSERRGRS